MPTATESLYDIVTSNAIAAYYEKLQSNEEPLLGPALFPAKKRRGLKLEWIKGYDSLPVALNPSAFDTKPPLRDRGGVATEETKMPFFREAMRIGEEDRQQLMTFLSLNADNYAQDIIARIFDDAKQLIQSSEINPEIMRFGLLTTGKFSIKSNDATGQIANYDYNYDPTGDWAAKNITTLSSTNKWSDHAQSNPVKDIIDVKREAAKRGIRLTRAIMGWSTWSDITQNEKIKKDMNPVGSENIIVTDTMVETYLRNKTGIKFQIYDKMYKDLEGNDQYFFPDKGCMTLLPAGTLGNTWFGTTPEEADLMSGSLSDAKVSVVNTGAAILTKKESLPVNVITSVSEIVLPSFENMNRVFNIKY